MDLRAVGAGALWVLGLGTVLAAFSYTSWWASSRRERAGLRRALGRPAFTIPFDLGLALTCAGFAVAGREWWEWLLWGVLAALFAAQAGYTGWQTWRGRASTKPGDPDSPAASTNDPG